MPGLNELFVDGIQFDAQGVPVPDYLHVANVEKVDFQVKGNRKFSLLVQPPGSQGWLSLGFFSSLHFGDPDYHYEDTGDFGGLFTVIVPSWCEKIKVYPFIDVIAGQSDPPYFGYKKVRRCESDPHSQPRTNITIPPPPAVSQEDLLTGQYVVTDADGLQEKTHTIPEGPLAQLAEAISRSYEHPAGGIGQYLIRWTIPPQSGGISRALPLPIDFTQQSPPPGP